jgi:hypothetical protein
LAVLRSLAVALVVLAVWALCGYQSRPHLQTANGPTHFYAPRAEAALARILGVEKPDPVGSANNAAVRERILKEFAAMGVPARTYRAFSCNGRHGFVACASVTDIIADAVPGNGKAIVLMAHYDSVPAGPGASDDKSGVATVLETVRALKARGPGRHPVIALFTDGEEAGLLGAKAFLENKALREQVGVVINAEARGTSGPSLLFQTSSGDGKLIDLYAKNVTSMAASSVYAEIYKVLPNDTDLSPFLQAGFPGYNFAFVDDMRYYHSPFDRRGKLSLATLQMHGDNVLGVTSGLEHTDYAALRGGDAIYISVLGLLLPRMPKAWALPFAVLVFLGLGVAAWRQRGTFSWRTSGLAALTPLAMIVGCGAVGFLLTWIAQAISGQPDPTYAYPVAMRLGLGLGVFAVTLIVSRLTDLRGAAASAWLWTAGFGVVAAVFLPGISPYFTFPAFVAAILLLAAAFAPGGWSGRWGIAAIALSALASLLVWLALVVSGESLMGLSLHPLFTVPAAFALTTAMPLLAVEPMPRMQWRAMTFAFGGLALGGAVIQGLLPAYSVASPQRANILLFQAGHDPMRWIVSTSWKAIGSEPPPPQMVKAMGLKFDENAYGGMSIGNGFSAIGSAYVAPAGPPRFALPQARVIGDNGGISLHLEGSPQTNAMLLEIPRAARLRSLDIRGQHIDANWRGGTLVTCLSPDCRDLEVAMTLAGDAHPVLSFAEQRYGLPDFAAGVKALRPAAAMASQSGDGVILADSVAVP